jgi:hypothetical protein
VWEISRWRGPRSLAHFFLSAGYRHLPPGSPRMFTLEWHFGDHRNMEIGLYVHFTNPFDALELLGHVFWCGCEFIAFTTYTVFTDFHAIFPPWAKCTPCPTTCRRTTTSELRTEDDGAPLVYVFA